MEAAAAVAKWKEKNENSVYGRRKFKIRNKNNTNIE